MRDERRPGSLTRSLSLVALWHGIMQEEEAVCRTSVRELTGTCWEADNVPKIPASFSAFVLESTLSSE